LRPPFCGVVCPKQWCIDVIIVEEEKNLGDDFANGNLNSRILIEIHMSFGQGSEWMAKELKDFFFKTITGRPLWT
jgi:hypothetical protein